MKIFISYRRSDSGYLATALFERLHESFDVFLDIESIMLGADFVPEMLDKVATTDVMIVLIGPGWRPDRLREKDDYLRQELLTARSRGKRVIPALHSGAQPLSALDLPGELAWLAETNMFEFGWSNRLTEDAERLQKLLDDQVPQLQDLRDQAWTHYERFEHAALIALVERAWNEHGGVPSAAIADCCRTAALSFTRMRQLGGMRDLWLARALSTAFLSSAPNAFAASLLPFFFRLMEEGDSEAARQVLSEISRLIRPEDPSQLPPATMMKRLVAEKRAYILFVDGHFEQALQEYQVALASARDAGDRRGELKIRGGMALCRARLGQVEDSSDELRQIEQAAARAGFRDVERAAQENLIAISHGKRLTAFEVT
jgi:tetratricopeptide (TPR) repeat protein